MFKTMNSAVANGAKPRDRLWTPLRLLMALHIAAVILFSHQAGMTVFAKITSVLLLSTFFVMLIGSDRKVHVPLAYRIWALWFLFAFASSMLSENPALERLMTIALLASVGFVLTNFLIWNNSTRFYLLALFAATGVSILWVMWDREAFVVLGRLAGPLGNANTYAYVLSVAMLSSFVMGLSARRAAPKISLLAFSALSFSFLLQTGSRKAMVAGILLGGTIIGVIHLYRNFYSKDGSTARTLIAAVVLVPVVLGALVSSEHWSRMEPSVEALEERDASLVEPGVSFRLALVERGIDIGLKNPILGVGIEGFRSAPEADHMFAHSFGVYSHSNYVEVFASTGVPGLILYLSIYLVLLGKLFSLRRLVLHDQTFTRYTTLVVLLVFTMLWDFQAVTIWSKVFWLLLPWLVAELYLLESRGRCIEGA